MAKLCEIIDLFIFELEASGRSANTIRNYSQEFAKLYAFWGDPSSEALTKADLTRFLNYLQTDYRSYWGDRLSAKSIKNIHGNLRCFCRWAREQGFINFDFDLKSPKAAAKPIDPLTPYEIKRLINASIVTEDGRRRPTAARDRLLIGLMTDCGLRVSEALALHADAIDLKAGRIRVTGKGNKGRVLFMGKKLRSWMAHYLLTHKGKLFDTNRHAVRQFV